MSEALVFWCFKGYKMQTLATIGLINIAKGNTGDVARCTYTYLEALTIFLKS